MEHPVFHVKHCLARRIRHLFSHCLGSPGNIIRMHLGDPRRHHIRKINRPRVSEYLLELVREYHRGIGIVYRILCKVHAPRTFEHHMLHSILASPALLKYLGGLCLLIYVGERSDEHLRFPVGFSDAFSRGMKQLVIPALRKKMIIYVEFGPVRLVRSCRGKCPKRFLSVVGMYQLAECLDLIGKIGLRVPEHPSEFVRIHDRIVLSIFIVIRDPDTEMRTVVDGFEHAFRHLTLLLLLFEHFLKF